MIEYADSAACLRASILRYFGDAAARERCDACGSCRPGAIDRYERECVQTILTGIGRAGERYGHYRIVAMLVGDTGSLPAALTGLPTTGSLRHESAEVIGGWLDASIAAGLVAVSTDQYRTLSLTDRGRDAMRGRLPDLGVRRAATGAVRLSRRRERIRDWTDWRTLKKLRRRAWSADPDAPCEFDGDYSRAFDAPDE